MSEVNSGSEVIEPTLSIYHEVALMFIITMAAILYLSLHRPSQEQAQTQKRRGTVAESSIIEVRKVPKEEEKSIVLTPAPSITSLYRRAQSRPQMRYLARQDESDATIAETAYEATPTQIEAALKQLGHDDAKFYQNKYLPRGVQGERLEIN